MSHFSVLVIGDGVDDQLAPYDENITAPPRRVYMSEEDVSSMRDYYEKQENKKLLNLEDLLPHMESWNGSDGGVEDGKLYYLSTYNESSKWDWYEVGGRWAGSLALKPEFIEEQNVNFSYGWDKESRNEVLGKPLTDSAEKRMIDIDTMRQEAVDKAEEEYDKYAAIVAEHGEIVSFPKDVDWSDEEGSSAIRDNYWKQPAVAALKEAGLLGLFDSPDEKYSLSRNEYIETARLGAVPGFATVYQGEWYEAGKMGWFGSSTETPVSRLEYLRHVNKIIDDLPDDTVLTIVDCHI